MYHPGEVGEPFKWFEAYEPTPQSPDMTVFVNLWSAKALILVGYRCFESLVKWSRKGTWLPFFWWWGPSLKYHGRQNWCSTYSVCVMMTQKLRMLIKEFASVHNSSAQYITLLNIAPLHLHHLQLCIYSHFENSMYFSSPVTSFPSRRTL